MKNIKIGLIKEGKIPPDVRIPFTPQQCCDAMTRFPQMEVVVQANSKRCYGDQEYLDKGIAVQDGLDNCDVIMGIKEVLVDKLLPNKSYFFFSHTIKKQPYNRQLLSEIIKKHIRLIDYECLKWDNGSRILGFGRFAGIVGAHNGLYAWGRRTGAYSLKRAYQCKDYEELKSSYRNQTFEPVKIVVTGGGRVTNGAMELLDCVGVKRISKHEFLNKTFSEAVYVQLNLEDYYVHKESGTFEEKDFFSNPGNYDCNFRPFFGVADMMVNAIYWDKRTPVFFTKEEMMTKDFNIKVIADISCDIMGSIPATLRSTSIDDPVFGYDPVTGEESKPYQNGYIDIMAVDNLPNELPRDASELFGKDLLDYIIPELVKTKSSIIERATITQHGALTLKYDYLQDYVF